MAIQKEIWMGSIVEGLFASNSFLSKAFNADDYVLQGKTVHIPNAGNPSKTEKNRTKVPATAVKRSDTDLTFQLNEFTTDPIYIPNAETIELSYDKRESAIRTDKQTLMDKVALDILYNWSPAASACIEATGAEADAYTPSATGKRKLICKSDVLRLMTKFNSQNIPQADRYLLLDAEMYGALLDSLTQNEISAFNNSMDVQNGVLGKLYSFHLLEPRSQVALYAAEKTAKEWGAEGAATDLAAGLAWHRGSVCRALGEVKVFENEGDPLYYGDIYSFLVRAGGRIMRNDLKGICAILQGTVA